MTVKRIVSITPSTSEILGLLGLGDRIVGCDELSHIRIANRAVESLGAVDNIDVERVSLLDPDLVIATSTAPGAEVIIEYMRDLDLPLLVLNTERFNDLAADIYTIGVECGVEGEARSIVEEISARTKSLCAFVRDAAEPLRAYFEWWPNPFVTSGSQAWVTDMLRMAGAVNVFSDMINPSFLPEEEEIIARDPEVIFICWLGVGDDPSGLEIEQVLNRKGWEKVSAIRTKQVHILPDDLFTYPGPSLLDGLELLIELVGLSMVR